MYFPFKMLTNKHHFLIMKADRNQEDKLKFPFIPYREPYRNERINHLAPLLDVVITPFGLFLLMARELISLSLGQSDLRNIVREDKSGNFC